MNLVEKIRKLRNILGGVLEFVTEADITLDICRVLRYEERLKMPKSA
jgi:hypothetical protein